MSNQRPWFSIAETHKVTQNIGASVFVGGNTKNLLFVQEIVLTS